VTDEVIREEGGLAAVKNKLRWLLSGPIHIQEVGPLNHMNVLILV